MNRLLVTGSSGLIGIGRPSPVRNGFRSPSSPSNLGWEVHGVDNNMRADFFGPEGDTRWNQKRLLETHKHFVHHELDIRDRGRGDQTSVLEGLLSCGPKVPHGRFFALRLP